MEIDHNDDMRIEQERIGCSPQDPGSRDASAGVACREEECWEAPRPRPQRTQCHQGAKYIEEHCNVEAQEGPVAEAHCPLLSCWNLHAQRMTGQNGAHRQACLGRHVQF